MIATLCRRPPRLSSVVPSASPVPWSRRVGSGHPRHPRHPRHPFDRPSPEEGNVGSSREGPSFEVPRSSPGYHGGMEMGAQRPDELEVQVLYNCDNQHGKKSPRRGALKSSTEAKAYSRRARALRCRHCHALRMRVGGQRASLRLFTLGFNPSTGTDSRTPMTPLCPQGHSLHPPSLHPRRHHVLTSESESFPETGAAATDLGTGLRRLGFATDHLQTIEASWPLGKQNAQTPHALSA
ncbi:hypothetical protein B0T11DRAFT_81089 [Plectosphaerella cucumerina]|uniref:Uncharacterized protein n=1 Tax=Plectosphaerella cucumerina TaxID=40658 RepID=A0A8K0X3G1_9PEZI|nr:hypothetical protein B0T11DRAFT_81089 [Plectosphaerella cucumerina]